ncbi:MAG: Dabb family protein [Anaerolineae bacterium]|nr:Dabb family protein [Anaerolineae bacterium]
MTIQRVVCFKFKADVSDLDIQKHVADFAALKAAIPQIRTYSGGLCRSGDHGAAPQYDILHYMTFASMDDVEVYYHHEAHQQFVQANRHLWENVLVLNSDVNQP